MITLKHYANEAIDIQSINDKLLSQLIEQKPAYLKNIQITKLNYSFKIFN